MKTRKLIPFGVAIKKALIDKGMAQVTLADCIGVQPNYINIILNQERPGKKYLNHIVTLLELEPENLLKSA